MEQVFQVSTGVIDGDPSNISNCNGILITSDDDIPNCAYIINLPEPLTHCNGVDNPEAKENNTSEQLTMEHPDDVAFTELRDLDNGVVTKVDSNDANGLDEEEPETKPDLTVNEVFLSFSLDVNQDENSTKEQEEDIIISLNGDKISAPSNLRKLIHQRQAKDCSEEAVADPGVQNPVKMEGVDTSNVDEVGGEDSSADKKVDIKKVVLDHCNNEPKLILVKKPTKTYSRKAKVVSEQPVSVSPGPTRASLSPPPPPPPLPALIQTTIVNSKRTITPSPHSLQIRKPLQVYVKTPEKLSIPIPVKKRQLVIDSQKQIKNSDFKKQLSQTEDIQQAVDLGPTSKMAMKLCMKSGGIAQLFSSPGRPIQNGLLSKLYSNNLVMDVDRDPSARRQKDCESINLEPLNSNDLKIQSVEGSLSGPNQSSANSTKKRIEIGKLTAMSLEHEFKCCHRYGVFKEYAKWKSPIPGHKRFSSMSYSRLKRNRELRKERQGSVRPTDTGSQGVSNEVDPLKEDCDDDNMSPGDCKLEPMEQPDQPFSCKIEEMETVPTSCGNGDQNCDLKMDIDDFLEVKIEEKETDKVNESALPEASISKPLSIGQQDVTVSIVEEAVGDPCPVPDPKPESNT